MGKNLALTIVCVVAVIMTTFYVNAKLDKQAPVVSINPVDLGVSSGPEHTEKEYFYNGLQVGLNGSFIDKVACGSSATWDPGQVASTTGAATTSVAIRGAVAGDPVIVSLNSVTSTQLWRVDGKITASASSDTGYGSATISLWGVNEAAVNLSTSTVYACAVEPA